MKRPEHRPLNGEKMSAIFVSTTSQKDFLEYLLKRISSKSLNLFLGAGISKKPPSNLPLAADFRACFFKELCTQERLAEVFNNYLSKLDRIPFESFVTSIVSDSNFFDCFVKIFGFGAPNKNHELIARLILKGHLSNILTTNFDALLEQSVLSLDEKQDLRIVYNERQFRAINLNSNKVPLICKIHGGIQEPASIRTVLSLIAKSELIESRYKILDYFFRTSGKDVLVLGYSCSDVFDINPFVENLSSKIRVIVVEHHVSDFKIEKLREPFDHFSGNQIRCNTDVIIDYLWNRLIGTKYVETENVNQDWTREIAEWIKGINSPQRLYLAGNILREVSEPNKAVELLSQGLNKASDRKLRANILLSLASAQALTGDYSEVARSCKESLPIFEEVNDAIKIAQCYGFIGNIEKLQGNYDEAEELLRKSLSICQKIGFPDGTARVLEELGTLYARRGNFENAKKSFSKSVDLHRKNGNLRGIAGCLHELGRIERIKGNWKAAKPLFSESLEIFKKLGSLLDIAGSKHELGLCEIDSGKLDEAKKLFQESLHDLEALNEHARIGWTLHDYSLVFYLERDYDEAEALIERSLEIKRSVNDQRGIAIGLSQIGVIRIQQGRCVQAEKLLMEALEISTKLKDRHIMKNILTTLEKMYLRKHDFSKLRKLAELRVSLFFEK